MNPYQLLIDALSATPTSELAAKTYLDKANKCYCAIGAILHHRGARDSYLSYLEHYEHPWDFITQISGLTRCEAEQIVTTNDCFRQGENDEESRKARWLHMFRWAKENLDRSSAIVVD